MQMEEREQRAQHWADIWAQQNEAHPREIIGAAWLLAVKPYSDAKAVERLNAETSVNDYQPIEREPLITNEDPYSNVGLADILRRCLLTLHDRERQVDEMIHGIGTDDLTYEEIGADWNRKPGTIRLIRDKALRKLKHPSRSRDLKSYLEPCPLRIDLA